MHPLTRHPCFALNYFFKLPIEGLLQTADLSVWEVLMSDYDEALHASKHDDEIQLVTFRIGDEEFGVDILSVQEINRMLQITMVPRAPFFIEGVINLRGKVIPVVNMRTRFNKPQVEPNADTRIVVVDLGQKVIGILVDAVSEVLRLPSSTIEAAPPVVAGIGSEYIKGVGKLNDRLLILLDLANLLREENPLDN